MPTSTQTALGLPASDRALSVTAQIALLLFIHVALWSWVGVSSRSNFDSAGDMVEAYTWAQGWQWGYYKHPPLSAWVVGLWFSVLPESHFGYSLLSAVNSAVGLAGLAFLAREFLPRNWVLLAVAVASLAPGVTTLAMRFNANAILVSTWPWALALFVRLMQRGQARDAVLCGLACALAMLGKYYSAVLLLSMLFTAMWLPAWRTRLTRAPFALAALTFLACMTPHTIWLLSQVHGPLQYAQATAGQEGHSGAAMRAFTFALAQCVFPLLAFLALRMALVGPARHQACWQATLAPLRPSNEPLWLLGMLPVLATVLATLAASTRTASVWGIAIAAGLALLATSRARDAGALLSLPRLWRTLGVVWACVAVLSPVWWQARAAVQTPSVSEPREELAQALSRSWHEQSRLPLPWISGTRALAASVSFYSSDHPRYWSLWNSALETPWVKDAEVQTRGGIIVCDESDDVCQSLAASRSASRHTVRVAKSERGAHFPARSYVFYLLPSLVSASVP